MIGSEAQTFDEQLARLLASRHRKSEAAIPLSAGNPVVLVALNMPGMVKNCPIVQDGFSELLRVLKTDGRFPTLGKPPVSEHAPMHWSVWQSAGDPKSLKLAAVEVESSHPLGRLWDIDVMSNGKQISRIEIGAKPRTCLICDQTAKYCSALQIHSYPELLTSVFETLSTYKREQTE